MMSGTTFKNSIKNENIRDKLEIASTEDKIRDNHLRWFGHINSRP